MIQRFVAAAFGVVAERATLLRNKLRSKVAQQKSGVSSALAIKLVSLALVLALTSGKPNSLMALTLTTKLVLRFGFGLGNKGQVQLSFALLVFWNLYLLTSLMITDSLVDDMDVYNMKYPVCKCRSQEEMYLPGIRRFNKCSTFEETPKLTILCFMMLVYGSGIRERERERERSRLTGAGQSLYARIIYSKPHYNI